MTSEQWRAEARRIPGKLSGLDRRGNDAGLNEAIFLVWRSLASAPSPIKHIYSLTPESKVRQVASSFDVLANGYGLAFAGDESDQVIVERLGGFLRALEREVSVEPLGSRRSNPSHWRVEHAGESAFLIPMGRLAWREPKEPSKDHRPFDQRGLLRLRLIPTVVDGAQVRIVRSDFARAAGAFSFGAVLFPGATFKCTETETTFVVDAVELPNGPEIIASACEAAHRDACLAAVFPELVIDPRSRDLIREQLKKKPGLPTEAALRPPGFVVAGSWHEGPESARYNIATVFDGHGDEILKHRKRLAYKDGQGRFEDIRQGEEFAILVLEEALFAFGICLDFCHRCFNTPYGELDVDFVIVPSCGDDKTMDSHIQTARDLHHRRKTRSFVVQQAFPSIQGAAGFVLNPDGNLAGWLVTSVIVAQPWSVFHCPILQDD
jgi:predicted amidohydrolase